eukprot:TRINITY_DN4796_c0_g1_i12.p1 TRINITY_DN4796_c0_g1~~TRINITY_DN4796_c0_g1_i12.p1  ORF type:complete len:142 (-),score=18.09 TRINITY_DN4796_c0_g1_i12:203-628(-)
MNKDHEDSLTPYFYNWLFAAATLMTSVPICWYLAVHPISTAEATTLAQWSSYPVLDLKRGHCWGLLGGAVWEVGTLSNALAGNDLGFALCYALGQSAPMMAVLYGVFYYKEFKGVSSAVWFWLMTTIAAYMGAITLIALSH